MSKSARWLALTAYLLGRGAPATRREVFANVNGYGDPEDDETALATARQRFERDKRELRELGIDIETVELPHAAHDEPQHGYRLKPGDFYLPYIEIDSQPVAERPYTGVKSIRLSEEDLVLLERATARVVERREFPLAKAAASARQKLAFDLPIPPLRVERILAEPMSPETEEVLSTLQLAVAAEQSVQCVYHSIGRDVEESRVLKPLGLFFDWGRWYCVATGAGDLEPKVFRVDRISDVGPPPEIRAVRSLDFEAMPAAPSGPAESAILYRTSATFADDEDEEPFDIRKYMRRPPWQLSQEAPVEVTVRIAYPESSWVEARGLGARTEPRTERGDAEFVFHVRSRGPFLRWLLPLRDRATIVDPTEFADELEEMRDQVAALYG